MAYDFYISFENYPLYGSLLCCNCVTGEVCWLHTDGGVVYTPEWYGGIAHRVPGRHASRAVVTVHTNLTEQPGVWYGPRKGLYLPDK